MAVLCVLCQSSISILLITACLISLCSPLRTQAIGQAGAPRLQRIGKYLGNNPRAVPTVLVIGAAKSGTTDLYFQLAHATVGKDPQRREPPIRAAVKEASLLSKLPGVLPPAGSAKRAEAFQKYMSVLGHPCANASLAPQQRSACLGRRPRLYTIDATPNYFHSCNAPALFADVSPESKVIMMVRDPVERLESLYNHWVLADPEWPSESVDALTDDFLSQLESKPGLAQALQRLAACGPNVTCQAEGWRAGAVQALLSHPQYRLYGSGLYTYALAGWRAGYFKPERVMLIDSHTYFRNRTAVMQHVVSFLYGRQLSTVEQVWAREAPPRNAKRRPATGHGNATWLLSPPKRAALRAFYEKHLLGGGMREALEGMKKEGAWVVGFERAPWPWAEGGRGV